MNAVLPACRNIIEVLAKGVLAPHVDAFKQWKLGTDHDFLGAQC